MRYGTHDGNVDSSSAEGQRWYSGVSRYQWLVLIVASLGWIFDIFEGQVFVASMREAMPSLVAPGTDSGYIDFLNKIAMASFLVGGALGGVVFGALADRIGRSKTLAITILVYSSFTLSAVLHECLCISSEQIRSLARHPIESIP